MKSKKIIWLSMLVGAWIGSYIPMLWTNGHISFSSLFFSALGALAGVWVAFKIMHWS